MAGRPRALIAGSGAVTFNRRVRKGEVFCSLSDAGAVRLAPGAHSLDVGLHRPAQALLAPMCLASRGERCFGYIPARRRAFADSLALQTWLRRHILCHVRRQETQGGW